MLPKGYHAYVLKYGARDGKRWGERAANMGTHSVFREGQPIAPPAVETDREVQTLEELEAAIANGDVHPSVHDELRDIMRCKEERRLVRQGREREVLALLASESGRGLDDESQQQLAHYLVEMGMVAVGSGYVRSEPGFDVIARGKVRVGLDRLLERWADEDGREPNWWGRADRARSEDEEKRVLAGRAVDLLRVMNEAVRREADNERLSPLANFLAVLDLVPWSESYLRMDPDVDDEVIARFRPGLVVLLVRWELEDGVG